MSNIPQQFEVIFEYYDTPKVEGENLNGELDYMYKYFITLFAADEKLKTVFTVKHIISTADSHGYSVDSEVEIVMNIYKYEYPFADVDLYGLFCHAYIVSYHVITAEINRKNILHDGQPFKPTMSVPSFDKVKDEIREEIKKVYG